MGGKFKFEVLGIGEIGADKAKSYSILIVEVDKYGIKHLKTKLTAKGIYSCCIEDDDGKKRNKLVEEEEGGVIRLDENKALIIHLDMIACVKEGIKGTDVYAMTIDTIRDTTIVPLKMATRWHWNQTFTSYYDKRHQRKEYYHSLAYGHSEATPLIPMKEVIAKYQLYMKEHKKENEENEGRKEEHKKTLFDEFRKIFEKD